MWLRCELWETGEEGETPLASVEGRVDSMPDVLRQLAGPVPEAMGFQLKARRLDDRLAKMMPELAAALFAGQEIPARKAEARLGWTPEGRPSLVVLLRGDFAGQWWDAGSGWRGGPLELIQRAGALKGDERQSLQGSQRWAEAFLAEACAGQAPDPAANTVVQTRGGPKLVASHPDAPAVDDSGAGGEAA